MSRSTAGSGENILAGPVWGENLKFASQNGVFWCTLYFLSNDGAPQTSCGPEKTPPFLTLSMDLKASLGLKVQTNF